MYKQHRRAMAGLAALLFTGFGLLAVGYPYMKAELKWLKNDEPVEIVLSNDARAARGTLIISAYGDGESGPVPWVHETIYVPGPGYADMEDNELRGFLDGHFQYGWNQVSQIHVRVGRRGVSGRFGEFELQRVLQRWEGIELPAGAEVTNARLELGIEFGPNFPVDVYLYEMKKDWNPGQGGVLGNNNSAPLPGEVWWNEAEHQRRPWGLPGAGFASDAHPDADTGVTPLAQARYEPGIESLHFSSAALAHYIERRTVRGKPLLFLVKLSDIHEDLPGTVLGFYSDDHGDDRNVVRRPRLAIHWHSPAEMLRVTTDVFLEHGRELTLGPIDLDGARRVAVSFRPVDGFEAPTVEIRPAETDDMLAWRQAPQPIAVDGRALMVRIRANRDPIPLGEAFTAGLRDTWVRTGPPKEQIVRWTFEAPTGLRHTVLADYQGDHRWNVRFTPDELGRWRYWWTQQFIKEPYTSAIGIFDVIDGDLDNVRQQLLTLRDEVATSKLESGSKRLDAFGTRFLSLERAVMRAQTPETFASPEGIELRDLLAEVRRLMSGKEAPGPTLAPDLRT